MDEAAVGGSDMLVIASLRSRYREGELKACEKNDNYFIWIFVDFISFIGYN